MKAQYCIQCKASTGEIGNFVFRRDKNGRFVPLSPIFNSLIDLYPWMRANGWKYHQPGTGPFDCEQIA